MDADTVSQEELRGAFSELALINRYLGGHAATVGALDSLLPPGIKRLKILDIGCGDGETAIVMADWAQARGVECKIVGIDLSEETIRLAAERRHLDISFFRQDLFTLPKHETYDIVHAGLMLHHCPGDVAARALKAMHERSRLGVAINDLHRHPLAYHAIKALTRLFSNSRLVRYDAPLSVLRGFLKPELEELCRRAGVPAPEIRRRWAFRWQMTVRK